MPMRRCSGESTKNSPPKDHHACPPRFDRGSWSTMMTRLPAAMASLAATRPARPHPITRTSAVWVAAAGMSTPLSVALLSGGVGRGSVRLVAARRLGGDGKMRARGFRGRRAGTGRCIAPGCRRADAARLERVDHRVGGALEVVPQRRLVQAATARARRPRCACVRATGRGRRGSRGRTRGASAGGDALSSRCTSSARPSTARGRASIAPLRGRGPPRGTWGAAPHRRPRRGRRHRQDVRTRRGRRSRRRS